MPADRDFRLLLAARTVSIFGTRVSMVAVPFAVLEITGSATDVGIVTAAAWVPQVLLLLFGGVIADRVRRQLIMVLANAVAALSQGASAVLLLTGQLDIPLFAALQACNGAATAFFFPASIALVPQVVAPDGLRSANAMLSTFMNGASIGGAAVGGLLAGASVGAALAIDAATYAVSAACCLPIAVLGAAAARGPSVLEELRAGWREFIGRRWLWVVVVQFGIVNACFDGMMFVLGPVQADRHLGGASAWGAVLACFSAGLLLGAMVSFKLRPRRPLLVGEVAVLLFALPVVLLVGPSPLALVAAAALVAGTACEIFGVQWSLAMQQQIPQQTFARLSSYDALGSFALIPVGLAVAGPLSDAIGMRTTLLGAAGVIVVATVAALCVTDVRDLAATDAA